MKRQRVFNILFTLSILLSCLAVQPVHAASILRVGGPGIDSGDCGATWENGCSLRHALELAASGDQIWVVKGQHVASDSDPLATFQLKNGVAVYGGFAGGETSLSQRNWRENVTLLYGYHSGFYTYHVVTTSGTDASTILDGFTIGYAGYAPGSGTCPDMCGAGILNINGSPSLANLIITDTDARLGSGMYNENGSPTLKNVTFIWNGISARPRYGGGMYNKSSSPILTNVDFNYNSADSGGAIYNTSNSNPVLTNVTFNINWATNLGGGIYNTGSSPTLINTTFTYNRGVNGGAAIYNTQNSSPIIYNSILWGDRFSEVLNENNSHPVLHYSLVQGGCPVSALCDHLLAQDPQFVVPPPGASNNFDVRLKSASPAIDAGDNSALAPGITTDLNGSPRFVDSPLIPDIGAGVAPIVDLGAYEAQQPIFYVKNGGTGSDCTSWALACSDLQTALALTNYPGQEIWVAAGTYKPTSGTDRSATFHLKNYVSIFGGFTGTESVRWERNWQKNPTYLSGDIGIEGDTADNSYSVVTGSGTDSTAQLDGFTVTKGNANVSALGASAGGGLYINSGSPVVKNVIFADNYAKTGGGVYNTGGQTVLTLENVTFSGNTADSGGGLYIYGSNPVLKKLTFLGNTAGSGGGMTINFYSSPTVNGTFFSGNVVSGCGGGIAVSGHSLPTVVNSAFIGNSAGMGGGICVDGATATLINLSFFDNSGTAFRYYDTNWSPTFPKIYNSILWGDPGGELNTSSFTIPIYYSYVQGLPNDPANQVWGDRDPLYEDGANGNLNLQLASPAIDAGDNSAVPPGITTDLAGHLRIINYPGKGTDSSYTVDLGAYETQLPYNFSLPAIFR